MIRWRGVENRAEEGWGFPVTIYSKKKQQKMARLTGLNVERKSFAEKTPNTGKKKAVKRRIMSGKRVVLCGYVRGDRGYRERTRIPAPQPGK